jgi:hypothetical protein
VIYLYVARGRPNARWPVTVGSAPAALVRLADPRKLQPRRIFLLLVRRIILKVLPRLIRRGFFIGKTEARSKDYDYGPDNNWSA